jgi:V/A-type H+-transporting ATPase subunit D
MRIQVNPTRMELTKLKNQYAIAKRGHKLLKDKQDELIKKFIDMVKENKRLREEVERELENSMKSFIMARSQMSQQVLEESLMIPSARANISISKKNIMSVNVPEIEISQEEGSNIYSYGLASTSAELDSAITILSGVLTNMIKLAEVEKGCQLMADEIEKTRRRVNALEYVMMPSLEETIKYITMKLDEDERANITRLMKVKELVMNG